MLTTEARVPTDRSSRYLVQLCKHFRHGGSHLRHARHTIPKGLPHAASGISAQVEWTSTSGFVELDWGRCILAADATTLTLRVEAEEGKNVRLLQELVVEHLQRFSTRDPLDVTWSQPQVTSAEAADSPALPKFRSSHPAPQRSRRRVAAIIAVGVLLVALHLGLGGALLQKAPWTGWAAGAVVAVVAVKVLGVGLLAFVRHRRKSSHGPIQLCGTSSQFAPTGTSNSTSMASASSTTSVGRVPTSRSERYAKQLCGHAAQMSCRSEWTPPTGLIEFPDSMGTCQVIAGDQELSLTLEAPDAAALARLEQILSKNIERFSHRDGLTVSWEGGQHGG